jgi:GNAT superfamily N-acetyltransferase
VIVRRLSPTEARASSRVLAEILMDCVAGGASVGFMANITRQEAEGFWNGIAAGVAGGGRTLFVAEDDDGICGTVQLVPATMPNQPHRADIAKMLVHRRARRNGVGSMLIEAAEDHARARAFTLLVLDTVTGSDASRVYERQGWVRSGDIPNYALWPDGRPCSTTVYFRAL